MRAGLTTPQSVVHARVLLLAFRNSSIRLLRRARRTLWEGWWHALRCSFRSAYWGIFHMTWLVAGLIVFLGVHAFSVLRGAREHFVANLGGELAYKGVYALLALIGLVLIDRDRLCRVPAGRHDFRLEPASLGAPHRYVGDANFLCLSSRHLCAHTYPFYAKTSHDHRSDPLGPLSSACERRSWFNRLVRQFSCLGHCRTPLDGTKNKIHFCSPTAGPAFGNTQRHNRRSHRRVALCRCAHLAASPFHWRSSCGGIVTLSTNHRARHDPAARAPSRTAPRGTDFWIEQLYNISRAIFCGPKL